MAVKITVRQADSLEQEADKLAVSVSDSAQSDEVSLVFDMPRIFIGRGEGADLRLPDPSVSARHASLRQRGSDVVIIDEGSTNGTALDSVLLSPQSESAPIPSGPQSLRQTNANEASWSLTDAGSRDEAHVARSLELDAHVRRQPVGIACGPEQPGCPNRRAYVYELR